MTTQSRRLRFRNPRFGLLALLLVLALALPGGADPPSEGFTPIADGIYIRLTQLNWLTDDGTELYGSTRVGVAELAFDEAAADVLLSPDGAFLNLYISSDGGFNFVHAVENLYLHFESLGELLDAHPGVDFDLGESIDGTSVNSLSFQITLANDPVDPEATEPEPSPAPAPEPTPSPSMDSGTMTTDFEVIGKAVNKPLPMEPVYSAPVAPGDFLVGGFNGGGSGQIQQRPAPQPFRPQWRPAQGRPVLLGAARPPAGGFPVVEEAVMGCAPGAVARSIRYMLDRRGAAANPTAQAIYQGLYTAMGTGAGGTSGQNMVAGKANWAAANNLNIQTQFPVNTLPPVLNALNNRGDVELNILWPGGGHVAMVTSVTQLPGGLLQITYIDDPAQGRVGNPSRNRTTTIVINPLNGAILSGLNIPGAYVATFMVENMP